MRVGELLWLPVRVLWGVIKACTIPAIVTAVAWWLLPDDWAKWITIAMAIWAAIVALLIAGKVSGICVRWNVALSTFAPSTTTGCNSLVELPPGLAVPSVPWHSAEQDSANHWLARPRLPGPMASWRSQAAHPLVDIAPHEHSLVRAEHCARGI